MSRDSGAGNNIKSSYSFYMGKGVMFGLTCHRKPKAQTWGWGVPPFILEMQFLKHSQLLVKELSFPLYP